MSVKNQAQIPRLRGRPGPELTEDFKERILNTAERLFATKGYAATAIRKIAEDVGVNPAMVHYYFGTKMQLLRAVIERAVEPLAGSVSKLLSGGQVNLEDVVGLLFSTAAEHPFLPQLITREVFLPGGQMQEQFLEDFAPRLGGRLPGILLREQQAGRIAPGVDVNIAALMILSLCFFPFVARPAAQQVLHIAYDEAGLRKIAHHISRLLELGVKA